MVLAAEESNRPRFRRRLGRPLTLKQHHALAHFDDDTGTKADLKVIRNMARSLNLSVRSKERR